MTATNHTITGILIASVVKEPLLALPIALISHLVLDMLPHYGGKKLSQKSKSFKIMLAVDCGVAASILLLVAAAQPTGWLLMVSCGILAASPDLLWLPNWLRTLSGKKLKPRNKLENFLGRIQWCERSWGWMVEVVYYAAALTLLVPRLSV